MRISILKSNRGYLERLSAQMESNPAEAVNYLLTELKRVGYSFNSDLTLRVGSLELTRSTETDNLSYAVNPEVQTNSLGSTDLLVAAVTKDPTIQHLLSLGLEEF